MSQRMSALVGGCLLGVVLVTGCGTAEPQVQLSPLSARLVQIDQALAADHVQQARADLAALAADTKAARASGDLTSPQADAILDAIIALRAVLPEPTPTVEPTPTPTSTTNASTNSTAGSSGSEPHKDAPAKGKGGDKGKKNGRK